MQSKEGLGFGGWGIGDWGLGPIPNPQSPIPNPQTPNPLFLFYKENLKLFINNIIIKMN